MSGFQGPGAVKEKHVFFPKEQYPIEPKKKSVLTSFLVYKLDVSILRARRGKGKKHNFFEEYPPPATCCTSHFWNLRSTEIYILNNYKANWTLVSCPQQFLTKQKYLVCIVFFVYIPTKFDWIWRSVYKSVNLVKVIRRLADNFFGTVGNN